MAKSKPAKPKPLTTLALPPAWTGLSAIVLDGTRVIAGGSTGGVAGFGEAGELVWELALPRVTTITLGGKLVAAHLDGSPTLYLIDRATGALLAPHHVPGSWVRAVAITPDGAHAVARVGNETRVFALPAFTEVKTLAQYVNEEPIACSPTHVAVTGHETHVFDHAFNHTATFTPANSPFCLTWTPDGKLAAAGNRGFVGLFEPDGTVIANLDSTPDKKTKKDCSSIAATATHLAVTRSDGVVVVISRETQQEVARFTKFEGAPLAFAADGSLWIGAARYAI